MAVPSQKSVLQSSRASLWILIGFTILLWIIQIVNTSLFSGSLLLKGIHPRQIDSFQGILWAPLLHGGFGHLMANTLPLLTLGGLIVLGDSGNLLAVTLLSALASGLGTWLIGAPNSVHIGASGIVFGYFGYLLLRGYFERSAFAITASVLVAIFYGGFLWGVLPSQPGVSWEGHLFGFIGGGVAAWLLAKPIR